MKIGVVRGDLSEREHLIRLVKERLGWEVIWSVGSGIEADQRCRIQKPDLMLMGIKLSGKMDGVEATRTILKEHECTIVIVSHMERQNTSIFKALSAGAIDAIEMPSRNSESISNFVSRMRKLKTVSQEHALKNAEQGFSASKKNVRNKGSQLSDDLPDLLIAIGCSTGGPGAVALLLAELPEASRASVIIIQHMGSVQFKCW
ncbi:chemotaxis protein CheB [Endozoicomonas atrinae]|uniref:chemotaxis protein CheB n=1 Tax=Endozoicomonas atrinae TaxID=1333660 RepID=UPI003B00CEBD